MNLIMHGWYHLLVKNTGRPFTWIVFVIIVIFIVTAVSNGANLTDGLDGLATGTSAIIGTALGILAYVSSNIIYAKYLNIMYIPGSEELVDFCQCLYRSNNWFPVVQFISRPRFLWAIQVAWHWEV